MGPMNCKSWIRFLAIALLTGCGAGSGTDGRAFDALPPEAPKDIKAQWEFINGAAAISVSWANPSSNVQTFVLERRKEGDEGFSVVTDQISADTAAFRDSEADVRAHGYTYRIFGTNDAGDSPVSPEKFVASPLPAAPSNLRGTATQTTVTLNWTDESNDETGFAINNLTLGVGYPADPGQITKTISGLQVGTQYRFQVTAINLYGSSDPSNEFLISTKP
jgi:hypothetical protein